MKTNYDKYMEEVWESKARVYQDFKKSGFEHYTDFIKNELKNVRVIYHNKKVPVDTGKLK